MTAQKPIVFASAWRAYVDSAATIAVMPSLSLVVVAISLVYGVLDYFVTDLVGTDIEEGYGPLLASSALVVVWSFFLTPFFIAVHRFIVLGEITPTYDLRPGDPRFLKFFGWTLFLLALFMIPGLLIPLAGRWSVGLPAVTAALMIGFFFVVIRSIILFPAIAVDAPGATWDRAFADTKGSFWRIFGIILLTMLPATIIGLLLVVVAAPSGTDFDALVTASLPASMVASALSMVVAVLAVAAASRLFESLGDRVKRPD